MWRSGAITPNDQPPQTVLTSQTASSGDLHGPPFTLPEKEEIAELLTKRAHCPHRFRFAVIAENKKTKQDTIFTWCERCGTGQKTVFAEEQEVS